MVLENRYANPMQLGADRWHAALGAVHAAPGESPSGRAHRTATTVDSIEMTAPGRYAFAGGRIAPGITLMQKGLFEGIPTLPDAMGEATDLPKSTADAVATGLIDAQVGLIVRAKHVFERTAGRPVRVIMAGARPRTLRRTCARRFRTSSFTTISCCAALRRAPPKKEEKENHR